MIMSNSLSAMRPELVREWSDKNPPLTPDMINEKSRKNVWWKCKTCGNEWKSVVYVRIKGDVVMKETKYHLYLNDSEYSRVYIFADLSEKQPDRARQIHGHC